MKIKFNAGKVIMGAGLVLVLGALSLLVYNRMDTLRADKTAAEVIARFEDEQKDLHSKVSNYKAENGDLQDNQLLTMAVEGHDYIGILEIESLGIKVPIQSSWSYSQLNTSPCRFGGTPKKGSFIIAGYNYAHQFALLKLLKEGTEVKFTDIEGNEYDYTVSKVETTDQKGVKEIGANNWDLTLFTCTVKGKSRVTVRCMEKSFNGFSK